MLAIHTKIYFDNEAVLKYKDEFASCGKKALIVTGHSSEKNSALNDVKTALDSHNISFVIFNEVEENPSIETVMKGRDFGLRENCDFLIAIGGGSMMDAAKAIAIMMGEPDKNENFLYDSSNGVLNRAKYELVAIPTTCGSGAEVTGNAVLTIHKKKTKGSAVHNTFPKVALIDGKYILGAPSNLIKRTSLDALAHLIESYVNSKATLWTRQLAVNGLSLWEKTKKYLIDEVSLDADICNHLMMSSTYAGICISHTGTSIPHRLSYRVTYGDKISHGTAVAYFLARFLNECEEKKEVLKCIGFNDIKEFSEFIDKIIGDIKVDKDLIEKGVDEILQNEKVLGSVKFKVNRDILNKIANLNV